jgi:hypothetical protein
VTKTTRKTSRKANGARESAPETPKAAPEARQGENAAQRQARVEAAFVATGKKRLAHSAHSIREVEQLEKDRDGLQHKLGHDRDGGRVAQWEKDKRTVLQALGHDTDGKCPAGVNWRDDIRNVPKELRAASSAASSRAQCHFPYIDTATKEQVDRLNATFPACGWKWCADKDRLKALQWADLLAAVEDLKAADIDPNDCHIGIHADFYAGLSKQRSMWLSSYKPLLAAAARNPMLERMNPYPLFLARQAEWIGATKVDKPMQLFLNRIGNAGFSAAVAAAILFLFGLAEEDRRYRNFKHSIEASWARGGDLNIRQK